MAYYDVYYEICYDTPAMKTKVNLTKLIRTEQGKRYCPAVYATNKDGSQGRLKANLVLVNGEEQHYPGPYYLDWTEQGKRKRLVVGPDPTTALNKKTRKEAELAAVATGLLIQPEPGAAPVVGTDLVKAVREYLADAGLDRKASSVAAYTTALNYFVESLHQKDRTVRFVEEIDQRDMRRFKAFLRDEKELEPRTVFNKFSHVMSFLKAHGRSGMVARKDWPVYTEEEVDIYEPEALAALQAVATPEEWLVWEFFLGTGFRLQEVAYSTAQDINFRDKTVRVKHKPEYGWTPKAYKERTVPVSSKLMTLLEPLRDKKGLLFPTPEGKPERHYWERLRAQARRIDASLNCPEEGFYLHKFRATFATTRLRRGFDLRTVMKHMGHDNIQTTMRYLKAADDAQVRHLLDDAA